MDSEQSKQIASVTNATDEQPEGLKEFLKAIAYARRQTSLYGKEHPNCQDAFAALKASLDGLLDEYSQITCVFSEAGVIVNDHFYAPSRDSLDMVARLRHRGVMAVTFIKGASQEETTAFLEFLNADAHDVMAEEGPSTYLRRRGVTTIVVTEAVYSVEGKGEDTGEEKPDPPESGPLVEAVAHTDPAISAVIEWLADQDDDKEEPKVPVTEILSDPDSAARLIREAVTKLHASRRPATAGEVATEVIHGLKHLAGDNTSEWDTNASQVRKAIAKLPEDMRPALGGFSSHKPGQNDLSDASSERIVDVNEVELIVSEALRTGSRESPGESIARSVDVEQFFGASAGGMLSTWKTELQAGSYLRCSGRTLGTLMTWESSAAEHARISRGLAGLVPRALEIGDTEAAFELVEHLCGEIARDDGTAWRPANARFALEGLETQVVKSLLDSAMRKENGHLIVIAAQLVEAVPSIAIELAGALNKPGLGGLRESLHKGLISSGRDAIAVLGGILKDGSPLGGESALHCLAAIGGSTALEEIARSLDKKNAALVIRALGVMPSMTAPDRAEWCIRFATSRSDDTRRAVLSALSGIGGADAIAHLRRVAIRGGSGRTRGDEQVAAIEALGRIDGPDVIPDLERVSRRRPLFGRSRYEAIARAAAKAIGAIRERYPETDRLAA